MLELNKFRNVLKQKGLIRIDGKKVAVNLK